MFSVFICFCCCCLFVFVVVVCLLVCFSDENESESPINSLQEVNQFRPKLIISLKIGYRPILCFLIFSFSKESDNLFPFFFFLYQ